MSERLSKLSETDRTGLQAEITELVSKWARRLQGEQDGVRAKRLSYLSAAELLAAELEEYAAYTARSAAAAGAGYAELADAAGLASRQIARHRWPGLAEVTTASVRGVLSQWRIQLNPKDGWTLLDGGMHYADHDGLNSKQHAKAKLWAAQTIADTGATVTSWDKTGPAEYTARLAENTANSEVIPAA